MDNGSRRFFITDSAEHGHALRLLVRHKVHDGRLPHNRIARISSGPGAGATCDACETSITKGQLVTEVALAGGRGARGTVSFQEPRAYPSTRALPAALPSALPCPQRTASSVPLGQDR
jgi:hypothetical protein